MGVRNPYLGVRTNSHALVLKQQPVDKYANLRYDPNWRNTKEGEKILKALKTRCAAKGGSMDLCQDSFYLHPRSSSGEKNQQDAKFQESFSESGPELLSFREPIESQPLRLHSRGNEPSDGCYRKDCPTTYSSALSLQIPKNQPQQAKKDFVEKNKQTLGLRTDKNKSYLQLHSKEQEVTQEQVADTKTVDEEPAQSALPNMEMTLEDKWNMNAKAMQKKLSQKKKVKSNQYLKGRALARNDNHQPAGRPAKPKTQHHQMSELQIAPMQATKQDSSSALQKRLCPTVGPDTNTAANSDTCLNNIPVRTSKKNKNCQRNHPNGLPRDKQHLYNHATVPSFPGDGSTSGQAHPNQKQTSSDFHVNYQGMVKDQDYKRHIHATSSLQPSQASVHSSPAALCPVSQLTQTVEQQHQEMVCLREAGDLRSFTPLPPLVPRIESEVHLERGDGNQVKISRRSSENNLLQTEKEKQRKVCTKPQISKTYITLDLNLGGLGPDYEAIKEKKEKLKQQREYAQRIKEQNMKNLSSVQTLPTKPQVTSARQKALEYAKMIPKPKTFTARQPDGRMKEERVRLPPITPLESLQSRHEKEKQVIAAFKNLRIL
ncbi:jhy protein homolog isoform X2 [Coturnix japonica]|uniref:jhy protein homolog isoform X2 n=1 Tax=Coturnix japonica TaxID=93934 RepID=UPI0013A5E6A7|nr:jhy protein homolog isoform X2 [Coturnix japonica]